MAKRRLAVEIVGDADKLDRAYKAGADGADRFEKRTTSAFDKAGESSDRFETKMSGLRNKADGWGKDLATGLGVGAGAIAAGLFIDGFGKALDREAASALGGVQLGLPPEMAKQLGEIAGSVWSKGFGDGAGDVNAALGDIITQFGGLGETSKEELKNVTGDMFTLGTVLETDVSDAIKATSALFKNDLAANAREALDLIMTGYQRGGNKVEDFSDVITDKAGLFRQFGLTGDQAIGMLLQSIDQGAPSAGLFAGALEELAGNAGDSADMFTTLGLNGQQMVTDFAAGGPAAAGALDLLLDRLRQSDDKLLVSQAFVSLFGEEATAMQAAVIGVDPSEASTRLGTFAGSAATATEAMSTNQQKLEEWKRTAEESVVNWIVDTAAPALQGWWTDWENGTGNVGRFRDGCKELGDGLRFLKDDAIDPLVGTLRDLYDRFEDLGNNETFKLIHSAAGGLTGLLGIGPDTMMAAGGGLFGLIGAFDTGGVVPGPKGKPQLALVHSGETILPTHEMSLGMAMRNLSEDQPGWDWRTMGNGLGSDRKWVDYEDGSGSWQERDANGNWFNTGEGVASGGLERWQQDQKAAMEHAALGWSAADTAAVQGLIDAGYTGAPTSGMPGTTVNNFYGPVTGEQDFIQRIRSGNYQAARTGRAF